MRTYIDSRCLVARAVVVVRPTTGCNKYVSNIYATSSLMARSSPTILVSSILFDLIDLVN